MTLAILFFIAGQTIFADVAVEEKFVFQPYRAIELTSSVEVEPGFQIARIQWRTRSIEVDLRPHDGGKTCSVWAPPGTYEIMLDAWLVNWDAKQFDGVERIFNITVEGARPPPKPVDPDGPTIPDPVTPTSGDLWSIVLRVSEKLSGSQSIALLTLREWADEHDGRVHHYEFSPDAQKIDESTDAAVKKYVDLVPVGSFYPYGFLMQKDAAGNAVVKWQGEIDDADAYIDRAKGMVK